MGVYMDNYSHSHTCVLVHGMDSGKFLPWTKTDLTVSLAERGLATLYTGRGAQYNVSFG